MRWWKSRFQRKHRSQDLIRGCGRQLMRWQLRALCKPKSCTRKWCRGTPPAPRDLCALILSSEAPSTSQGQSKQHCSSSTSSGNGNYGSSQSRWGFHNNKDCHGNKKKFGRRDDIIINGDDWISNGNQDGHRLQNHGNNRHKYRHSNKRHNKADRQEDHKSHDNKSHVDFHNVAEGATVNETYWDDVSLNIFF